MTAFLLRCLTLLMAFGLFVALSPLSYATANLERVTSEYLRTDVGSFVYKLDSTWELQIDVSPTKAAPGGTLYLLASFENPQGGKPLISSAVVPSGKRQSVVLNSAPISGMRDDHAYLVTVRVFDDKAHN